MNCVEEARMEVDIPANLCNAVREELMSMVPKFSLIALWRCYG